MTEVNNAVGELKHTPGPWIFLFAYSPETVPEYEVLAEKAWDGVGYKFKQINIGPGDGTNYRLAQITSTTLDRNDYDQFEANAKLIAAAPDLLQACIQALKDLEARNVKFAYTLDLLHDAIKKATA
jgi:hypothetical protein